MSIFAVNRAKGFIVERHREGDELWLTKHPSDKSEHAIVIAFDRPFEEIMQENAYVVLSTTANADVEIMYFLRGKLQDFTCCHPRSVPRKIRGFEVKYNNVQ